MTPGYFVGPKAVEDIDSYTDYLARESTLSTGLRFLEALHNTLGLLASHPRMGWQPKLKHPELATFRVFRVSGFERMLILYRMGAAGIEVLRVVHGARNIQRLLLREGI